MTRLCCFWSSLSLSNRNAEVALWHYVTNEGTPTLVLGSEPLLLFPTGVPVIGCSAPEGLQWCMCICMYNTNMWRATAKVRTICWRTNWNEGKSHNFLKKNNHLRLFYKVMRNPPHALNRSFNILKWWNLCLNSACFQSKKSQRVIWVLRRRAAQLIYMLAVFGCYCVVNTPLLWIFVQ